MVALQRFVRVLMVVACLAPSGACATKQPTPVRIPRPASLQQAFDQLKGTRDNAGVVLISNNTAAWAARWELLTGARHSIDLSTFIFDNDVFGRAVLGALTERARAGVKVRLLIDGRGSLALSTPLLGRDFLQEMVQTGNVDVHVYNPPMSELVGALLRLDAVPISAGSHNKILAVDGAIAIVGGRNVSAHYFATEAEDLHAVSDVDVLLDGAHVVSDVVDVMDREFNSWKRDDVVADPVNFSSQLDELLLLAGAMDAWMRGRVSGGSDGELVVSLEQAARARLDHAPDARVMQSLRPQLRELVHFKSVRGSVPFAAPPPRVQAEVRVVATLSRARAVRSNAATDGMLRAIGGAHSSITVQSPSFILSPQLLLALQEASGRGVNITLLTNSPVSTDSRISASLFFDTWPELMARIPRLRIFTARTPHLQHGKRAVFDDDLSFVGTYNLDPFSTNMNSETVIAVWSPELVAQHRIELLLKQGHMDEYRIARAPDGSALRHPAGHAQAGQVVVLFGPRDQVDREEISRLESVKGLLLGLQGLWDFDVVVW